MLKLIEYNEKDTNYLWQTYKKAMQAHIEKIWGWDVSWQKADFAKSLNQYTTCLISHEQQSIGYVQYKVDSKHAYINRLILEAEYQSKGLGSQFFDLLVSQHDLISLKLRCFKVNTRAYQFYLRKGFEVIDEDENFYLLIIFT